MEISSTTETLDQFTAGLEAGFINVTLATLGCKEIYRPPCSWVDNITCSLNPPTENRTENPGLNISNEDGCFHQSLLEDTTEFRHYKQFSKTVGLITIVVSSCGILGNLLSILVLVLKETRNCFNQLLIALNIFDSLFLVFAILEGLRTDFNQIYLAITSQYFLNFVHYPLLRICMCASIFLIIGVAVERYLAVCRPHHYRELQVQNYRAFIYIVPSALAAIGLNFPRFLEITTADYCIVMEECGCETIVQTHHVPSDMRNHPLYVLFYSNLAWLFFTGIIPFIVLTILNLKIYRSMQIVKRNLQKSSTVGGAAMRAVSMGKSAVPILETEEQVESRRRKRVTQQNKECNLAFILICTVVTFFICHIPRVMTNVYEALIIKKEENCKLQGMGYVKLWYLYIIVATNLMLVLNATVNLPIYLSGGKSFRASFIEMFGLEKCVHRSQNINTCGPSPQTEMTHFGKQ